MRKVNAIHCYYEEKNDKIQKKTKEILYCEHLHLCSNDVKGIGK